MTKSRITIKDIARELKISTSTVSRALAEKWDVNPETRKSVMALAEKWNYTPNPISRSLKQRRSMLIGVIVPEFINSFFAEVVIGIESALSPKGFNILLMQSNESHEIELRNLKALESQMVDGLIVSVSHEVKNNDYYLYLQDNNYPLVFFNRTCSNIDASKVIIDDYKWAFIATEHLMQNGRKRIVHLMGPENLLVSQDRKRGYKDALEKHGIPFDPALVITCGLVMEGGVMAAHKMLEMSVLPDAIFAVNDPVAIGAMKTLQKNGIQIPADIAIVGFSESKMAMIVEPHLTSVEQPTFEMGKIAAEVLLEQITNKNDESISPRTITLNAKLNKRDSSGPS